MKLSIIIPIYNAEKYVAHCIDSVLAQSYDDFELLLVDDGSTDGSGLICDNYALKDARIKVYHKSNQGPSATRNFAIKRANGSYIGFIDADDLIHPQMYQILINTIEKDDADVVFCNFIYKSFLGSYETITKHDFPSSKILDSLLLIERYYAGSMTGVSSVCNKVYKKFFLDDNNLWFDESLVRAEDYWFNFFLFLEKPRIVAIDDALYYYMQYPSGNVMKTYRETQFGLFIKNLDKLKWYNENCFNEKFNYKRINRDLLVNTSELIHQMFGSGGGFSNFKKITSNEKLKEAFKNKNPISKHLNIFYTISFKCSFIGYMCFKCWYIIAKIRG